MKKMLAMWCALGLLVIGSASAMDGVFDRSAEVEKYLDIVKNGTRIAAQQAARDIYVSGITDTRLATAMSERLLADYSGFKMGNSADEQYGAWMVKGLSSLGIDESNAVLKKVEKGVKVGRVRTACQDELELASWHKTKNAVMASRKYHNEGDNPRVSQFLNLLMADDFALKYYAADRMNWEKQIDIRLTDAMSAQLLQFMDSSGSSASRMQGKAMGMYAKLLGFSGQAKYRDTLQKVMASKASSLIKKHTKEALGRLQ